MNITPHDIGTFLVESRSRPDEVHIIDVNDRTCSCESFQFNKTCQHLKILMNEPDTQELALVPEGEHAQIETLRRVDNPWEEFEGQIPTLETSASALVVTKENYLVLSDAARAIRLKVRKTRIAVEHKREELVEDLNKRTGAINKMARTLREKLESMEEKLLEQEKFAEIEAARIQDEKRIARIAEITPFLSAPPTVDLGLVKDDAYAGMLQDAKDAHTARLAREQKEKEEAAERARIEILNRVRANELAPLVRFITVKLENIGAMPEEEYAAIHAGALAGQKAEAEAIEAQRIENERLKKEADQREALAKKEREEAAKEKARLDKQLADERKAAEEKAAAITKEAKAKADAAAEVARKEREAIQAKADAEAKAAREAAKKENDRLAGIAEQERQKAATAARVAREAKEESDKEIAAIKAAGEAEKKRISDEAAAAAKAPDKEKLAAFAEVIWSLKLPELTTDEGKLVLANLESSIKKLGTWLEKKASEL
jgi:hypothetical protein